MARRSCSTQVWYKLVKSPPHLPAKACCSHRNGWFGFPQGCTCFPFLIKYLIYYKPKVCVPWLSPFGRFSPWQIGITIWKRAWQAKVKWHRKVKYPPKSIQETHNCAKLLPVFSSASCCLSAWISHLASPLLVLCYASRARLHHVCRVIFREKLLQPCPAKQAGTGVFDALLLHNGTGTAELAPALGMLCFHDLQPCQCLSSHEMENSVPPDVKVDKKAGEMAREGSGCHVFFQRAPGKRHLASLLLQPSVSSQQIIPTFFTAPHNPKSLSTVATLWDCLMVSPHIPLCPGRVFLSLKSCSWVLSISLLTYAIWVFMPAASLSLFSFPCPKLCVPCTSLLTGFTAFLWSRRDGEG